MGRIFYLLSVRFDSAAAWLPQNLGGYRWISVSIVAVLCLQLLFTYWGPMHSLFGTSAIDDLAWLWAIMIGLLVFCAVESEKTWRRSGAHARLSRRREPARAE